MKSNTAHQTAAYWKSRYQRQQQLIAAMTSLLSRYGSTVNTEELERTFVLTLMGHFQVGDAALYMTTLDGRSLEPVLAYGRARKSALPKLKLDDAIVVDAAGRSAHFLKTYACDARISNPETMLAANYELVSLLALERKLIGMVFLGPRVGREPYVAFDLSLLDSLAAVSAAAFNDAIMYRNARLHAEALRKLLQVRADIISRVTHEFRTPLTVLRAGVETLDATADGRREWMTASVERLQQLIDSLLALSGQSTESSESFQTDPLSAIHEAVGAVSGIASQKQIRLSVSSSSTVQASKAPLSSDALKIVLEALITNALVYSPPGSAVMVETDVVSGSYDPQYDGFRFPEWIASTHDMIAEFTALSDAVEIGSSRDEPAAILPPSHDASERYLVIRVTDEGIGIPSDELAFVAEPFRQASNCPDRGVKGKGLGLALAQRSLATCGGFMCCRSALGTGTRMSVFLPLR